MSEHHESTTWSDAPDGMRFSLGGVNEELWMPLSEVATLLKRLSAPGGDVLVFLAWRITQGTISAKAGRLLQAFDDSPEYILYNNMPITTEWATEIWSSSLSEHWTTNAMRVAVSGYSYRTVLDYQDIALDRFGVERLVEHLTRLNSPSAEKSASVAPQTQEVAQKRRGRTPGSGGYKKADEALIAEMRELISQNIAASPNDAARLVADKAKGASVSAAQTRLRKLYIEMEKNGGN